MRCTCWSQCSEVRATTLLRLNKNITRRTRVIGTLPNSRTYVRLVITYLIEYAENRLVSKTYPIVAPPRNTSCSSLNGMASIILAYRMRMIRKRPIVLYAVLSTGCLNNCQSHSAFSTEFSDKLQIVLENPSSILYLGYQPKDFSFSILKGI